MTKNDDDRLHIFLCFVAIIESFVLYASSYVLFAASQYALATAFFIFSTCFFLPPVISLCMRFLAYLRARKLSRVKIDTIVIGGISSGKKKRRPSTSAPEERYHSTGDVVTKGSVMRELGLSYNRVVSPGNPGISEASESVASSGPLVGDSNILKDFYDELRDKGHIQISHQAHYKRLRGADIGKRLEHAARRDGLDVSVRNKGKDIVVSLNS